jgi:predicted Kef-type K+ transport protein
MDALFIAIDYRDALWLTMAFVAGFAFQLIGLPPLIGFLVAGFTLNFLGAEPTQFLSELADMGVTLLLFTIGLKLRIKSLLRPEIWGVASAHMSASIVVGAAFIMGLGAMGLSIFAELDFGAALIAGFALSFSSTVFAVKFLESVGQSSSRFGRLAIGVLIIQDVAAVIFLAFSSGKLPSAWAFLLFLLPLLRKPVLGLLHKSGHGELQILIGFVLALGGAQLFEILNLKGDLGALIIGIILSSHIHSERLARSLLGFKELFLVAFFLDIGLAGTPTSDMLLASSVLLILIPLKIALFYILFTRFRLMATTAHRGSLILGNYSEFGLIVAAIAISDELLAGQWLLIIAVALSFSYFISAILNNQTNVLFTKFYPILKRFEHPQRLHEDKPIEFGNARVIVFGMGRVGCGVYDAMNEKMPGRVLGVDHDEYVTERHLDLGRKIITGNASNPEFWDRVCSSKTIEYVMLVIPRHEAQLAALKLIRGHGFTGKIAASAKYPDEVEALRKLGVEAAFNIYAEAGTGFARHVTEKFELEATP